MKKDLWKLPRVFKELVQAGVYAVYEIKPVGTAKYLIIMKENFLMEADGTLLDGAVNLEDYEVLKVVKFPEIKLKGAIKV